MWIVWRIFGSMQVVLGVGIWTFSLPMVLARLGSGPGFLQMGSAVAQNLTCMQPRTLSRLLCPDAEGSAYFSSPGSSLMGHTTISVDPHRCQIFTCVCASSLPFDVIKGSNQRSPQEQWYELRKRKNNLSDLVGGIQTCEILVVHLDSIFCYLGHPFQQATCGSVERFM